LEGLGLENVGIFYDHLEYFMAIWYNLLPSGIVCGHLVQIFTVWYVWTKINLATLLESRFAGKVLSTETDLQAKLRR
jgi:hypothetical protein